MQGVVNTSKSGFNFEGLLFELVFASAQRRRGFRLEIPRNVVLHYIGTYASMVVRLEPGQDLVLYGNKSCIPLKPNSLPV